MRGWLHGVDDRPYEKTIKALTGFAEERGSTYTPSLDVAFASMTVSPRTGRFSAQRRFDTEEKLQALYSLQ